jgi:hypothetical protein
MQENAENPVITDTPHKISPRRFCTAPMMDWSKKKQKT